MIDDSILVVFEVSRAQLLDIKGNHLAMLPGGHLAPYGASDANASWILTSSGGADSSLVNAYSSSSPSEAPRPFFRMPESRVFHPASYLVATTADNTSIFGAIRVVPVVEVFDGELEARQDIDPRRRRCR